jgi:diguanylate cyclase (GGDEF)-like protein/PAS domain S-box-containing protein
MDQAQLLASIAATAHDCILSVDAAGAIVWASPATLDVLGWTPDDLSGRAFDDLFPAGSSQLRAAAVERLLRGDRVEPFVDTAVRRDGTTFAVQLVLGPIHDPDGAVTGVIVILRDVTAQLDQQRELTLALEMSRAHFDQAATPQAILGLGGRLESVNPAWCELFGHGEGWFADCDVVDLVHPEDTEAVVARLRRLAAGEIDSISYRGVFRDADDRDLHLVLDASLLREPDGRPYAIAASIDTSAGANGEGVDDQAAPAGPGTEAVSEALGRRAIDTAVVLDEHLVISHVAEPAARMLGFECDDMTGRLGWEFIHPADAPAVATIVERLLADPGSAERAVLRVRDADDQWCSLEVTAHNFLADPEVGGIIANLRDVTDQVKREESLRVSEALHRAMVESAQEGILATSPEGQVVYANETAGQILGVPAAELRGMDPRGLGLASYDEDASGQVHEVSFVRPDGEERIVAVSVRPLSSRDGFGLLVSLSDLTDVRRTERTLRRRALHDPLTGLPNRYLFLDRLETAAARQRRFEGRGTAVLFLDLDGFKQVNDGFGHTAGDQLLRAVATRLLESVRATDTVGRLGGDEFAVICEDTGAAEARVVAQRILDSLEEEVSLDGRAVRARLSIGIALAPPYSFDEVVQRADEAMYRAKQDGGGRIEVDEGPQPPA